MILWLLLCLTGSALAADNKWVWSGKSAAQADPPLPQGSPSERNGLRDYPGPYPPFPGEGPPFPPGAPWGGNPPPNYPFPHPPFYPPRPPQYPPHPPQYPPQYPQRPPQYPHRPPQYPPPQFPFPPRYPQQPFPGGPFPHFPPQRPYPSPLIFDSLAKDPTFFEKCSCVPAFNCRSPGLLFGSCDAGRQYCCEKFDRPGDVGRPGGPAGEISVLAGPGGPVDHHRGPPEPAGPYGRSKTAN